jgi:hypothetical protein
VSDGFVRDVITSGMAVKFLLTFNGLRFAAKLIPKNKNPPEKFPAG